jgi:MoxR-like ATPase
VADAVAVTRMTRRHDHVRQGSSVRGAIDLFLLTEQLCLVRGIDEADERYPATFFDAMLVALSGRLLLDEATGAEPAGVLREIWENHFVLDPASAEPG